MPRKPRGRPLKFGRRAQLLALTLPHDVVRGLRRIHRDPAWAIVALYENRRHAVERPPAKALPGAELASLSPDRSLIVVDPHVIPSTPGVSVVPVAAGRAFLAFGEGRGLADLEIAIQDRLRAPSLRPSQRKELLGLHRQVRAWRHSRRLRFSTRSIIIVERTAPARRTRRPRSSAR